MKKSSWAFLALIILTVLRVSFCGTIIDVGMGKDEKLTENFDFCFIIIILMLIVGILGGYQFIRERKFGTLKNKLIISKLNEVYDNKGNKISKSEIHDSDRKRLSPTKEVLEKLLRKSGNKCHIYPCHNVIIDYQENLQGHVVSIISNEKNQPNYNPKISNDNRIKISNMMLLCHDHYFDLKLREKFTIDELISKKIEAEEAPNKDQTFEISDEIINGLIQGYDDRYL